MSKKEKKVTKFLEKMLFKEGNDLLSIVIFQDSDGSYQLYDKYNIKKTIDGTYTITVRGTHTEKNFYKLKNAFAWCGYEKRNIFKGAKRIHQLDQMIYSMDNEIQVHTNLVKNSKNMDSKLIYLSKLTEDKAKKKKFNDELQSYLNEYNKYQNLLYSKKPVN